MGTLRAIVSEIVHLFVDDGLLALALVVWCAVVGGVGLLLPGLLPVAGPALFLGCVVILLGTVVRAARGRTGMNH
jgi:hypothetical protein